MIKNEIKNILRLNWPRLDEMKGSEFERVVADEICAMVEDEIMTSIKTAVTVRIHGIPA